MSNNNQGTGNQIYGNEAFVKELLKKMEVLKNGIIDERKKNSFLEKKYDNLREFTDQKENEIMLLSREKQELIAQLAIERKKLEAKGNDTNMTNTILSMFTSNSNDNNQSNHTNHSNQSNQNAINYEDQLAQLKFENEALNHRLVESLQQYEQYKENYKKLISEQTIRLQSCNKTIEERDNEIITLQSKIGSVDDFEYKMQEERSHFTDVIRSLTNERDEYISKFKELYLKLQKLTLERETLKEAIYKHEVDSGKLAQKLAEYKNALLESNLKIQVYHCEKIGLVNKEIDITFGETDEKRYVMKITDDKKKSELINIEDVEYIKVIQRNEVEIKYMHNSKNYNIMIKVNQYIVDQFIQAYNTFYAKSVKVNNNIGY